MADERMPEDMISWMTHRGWGEHHDQWHFERRWDFWHARAAQPNAPPWIQQMIDEATAKGWTRASIQEGQPGNGEDFLFMHRAMIQLLLDNFPQHLHYLRGWGSPPQDLNDAEDPVPPAPPGTSNPAKGPFNADMAAAVGKIEASAPPFASDDEFGLFVETRSRPTPGDPLATSSDPQTGIHNYMHNRWSDNDSPINLGDPTVNIFNHRFWKLHGWIDHSWWRFRRAMGFEDTSTAYREKLAFYVTMMDQEVHHPHFAHVLRATVQRPTRNVFAFDVPAR